MALSPERITELRVLIAKELEVEVEQITDEAEFQKDLKADSLDQVEMVMAVEERFKVDIDDEVRDQIKTVGHLIAFLDTHVA